MKKIIKYIKYPSSIIVYLMNKGYFKWLNDKTYLKIKYRIIMNTKLNLENPQTFNEKLQWLKLYDRNPEYIKMVDKYEAKKYVANIIGEKYIIPTLGVWDKFEDIEFEKLPKQFVLKPTHTSGNVFICKDKEKINYKQLKKMINKWLKRNYYLIHREWPYKNVKPRIIAEKYMQNKNDEELKDYKFYCFNGKVDYVMVCTERETGHPKFYFYNRIWNFMKNMTNDGIKSKDKSMINKPENIEKMFEIAEILSKGKRFVRLDLYNVDGRIYFGEFTFFPQAGFDTNRRKETDEIFSEKLQIGGIKK